MADKLPPPLADGEAPMLKVTVLDSPTQRRLVVEGDLAGPSVSELESIWRHVQTAGTKRSIVVDPTGATLIDTQGKAALMAMAGEGAKLVADGVYTAYLVKSLMQRVRAAQCRF